MYLSRLALDFTKRATLLALQNPAMFHGAVESSFEKRPERALWRIDALMDKRYLMLLSEEIPCLDSANAQFGTGESPETRDYSPLLARIQSGQRWRFRLCANPTYSKKTSQGRGEVCAHITPEHQRAWLIRQGVSHGFSLGEEDFDVVHSQWYSFPKGEQKKRVELLSVAFEGLLNVTDAEAFRETLTRGFGRGKAYGMGMMTVVRPEDGHG